MRTIESLEGYSVLIKGVTKQLLMKQKKQNGRFLGKLVSILCAIFLRNMLADKRWHLYS